MKNKKLEKCISELNQPIEERNEKIIIDYLKALEPLMTSIKEKSENSEEIIKKLPPLMTYQKFNKNDIIYEYGQKIADIYLILNGNVTIITPKIKEYYMNEEEFIIYLLKLRKNNQKELLNLCIKYNAGIFSFNSELLSDFLFNLEKNRKKIGDIFNNEKIIDEAYDVIKSMRLKRNINNKKIKNYSPEKYLSLSDIDEEIKINSEKIKNKDSHENSKESIENERKLVKLIMYEQISILNKGEIFGDNMIESVNSKMNQTIISLSDCDLVKINKINYNDLMKGSLAKLKNKFYNLILTYKIFMNIPYASFDKKYYNYFKYVKLTKNQMLFKEGDICDKIYFISNGEYELFVDISIQEINKIIIRLKSIVDDLKKFILVERKKILNNNISKKNIYLKLKNNLNQFFNKFEGELNLDDVVHKIKVREINNKKQFLENKLDKYFLTKKRIKLGIFKTRQIIGLNDIINRDEGNICIFNCKCSSFEGELCFAPYKNFLTIYEIEDKVNLYTSELLFQNIYYIIERLLSHKKIIIDDATKKENEIESKLNYDNNKEKIPANKISDKAKINFMNILKNFKNEETSNNNNKYSKKNSPNPHIDIKNIVSNFNNNPHTSKNIYGRNNRIKMKKKLLEHNLSERKEIKEETINENKQNNKIKDEFKIKFKNIRNKNIQDSKSLKFINNYSSRNLSSRKPLLMMKTKSHGVNTIKTNINLNIPMLVINDNEVKVIEDYNQIHENKNKSNYENRVKNSINFNEKMANLFNNNEIKNIILSGDFREKIQKKLNLKLLKKAKNILLKKNKIKSYRKEDKKIIDINEHNFQLILINKDKQTTDNINQEWNSLKNSTSRNLNSIKHIKNESIKFERKINNIIFKKPNQLTTEKNSLELKNKTFNDFKSGKKEKSNSQNLFFKNTFLKKNLSDFPFLNESKSSEKNYKNFIPSSIRNKIYHLRNLRKIKNRFIQTPNSFMNSFNSFKRKMEKLNII